MDDIVARLEKPVGAEKYDEDTLNWKQPSDQTASWAKIRIDSYHHNLIIEFPDGKKTVIEIGQMTDVRTQPYSDETKAGCLDEAKGSEFIGPAKRGRFFSLAYYKGQVDFVHVYLVSFVVDSAEIAETWRTGMAVLIKQHYQLSSRYVTLNERIERIFSSLIARQNLQGEILVKEFDRWFKDVQCSALKTALEISGKKFPAKKLSFQPFKEAIIETLFLPPVRNAMQTIVGKKFSPLEGEPVISTENILELVNTAHRDPRSNEVNQPPKQYKEIEQFVSFLTNGKSTSQLNTRQFYELLQSESNDVLHNRGISHNMNHPLSHYYCNSSHNTYLIGKQLLGRSTVEVYRQVLLAGCRCIELDIWNGENTEGNPTPIITHGGARCTNVLFSDCLKAIRDTAFVNTEYPVVLSFENHCDAANQVRIAKDCREIFGDLLCSEYKSGDGEPGTALASPDKLKRLIIIKNKRQKSLLVQSGETDAIIPDVLNVDGEEIVETEQELRDREARSRDIVKELSDIVNYVWPIHFKGFDVAQTTNNHYHMSSFHERKAKTLLAGDPEAFCRYTSRQIARIYPHGSRIQSSNYNPIVFWNVGAQMVALNWQTLDTAPMQRNLGKFIHNGGCGYILKPAVMVRGDFTPFRNTTIDTVPALTIKVQILSAPCVGGTHPEVEVKIQGLPTDTTKEPMKTRPFKRKTPVPAWLADNTASFPMVVLPDAAQLCITVKEQEGRMLGWSVLTLSEMKPGFRIIPLNYANSPLAHVFVKISMDIFSGNHADFADRLSNPTKYTRKTDQNMAMMTALEEDQDAAEDTNIHVPMKSPDSFRETPQHISLDNGSGDGGDGTVLQKTQIARASTAEGRVNNYEIYDAVEQNDEVRAFRSVCARVLADTLAQGKAALQKSEPKAVVSLREQQIKKRNKHMAEHNKVVKGLRSEFTKDIKKIFKDKVWPACSLYPFYSDLNLHSVLKYKVPGVKKILRKSTKRGSKQLATVEKDAPVASLIASANSDLISRELEFTNALRVAFDKMIEVLHPLMRTQEDDVGTAKVFFMHELTCYSFNLYILALILSAW